MDRTQEKTPCADIIPFSRPPYNIEAEMALLGAMLVNNDAYEHVSGWVKGLHFYDPLHGRIYDAMCAMIDAGRVATAISVKTYFTDENADQGVSVAQYLGRLSAGATTIINAPEYGRAIYEAAQMRGMMVLAGDMARRASDVDLEDSIETQIEDAEAALYELGEEGGRLSSVETFGGALRQAIEEIDAAWKRGDGLSGISTGIGALDRQLGGLADSDLIIIGGRPSMGKTTLAVNMAYEIAQTGAPVAFFSLEMGQSQLAQKILSTKTGISTDDMRRGRVEEEAFRRLIEVSARCQDLPLYIDQQGALSIAQLSMRARRMKRRFGIKAIFIDYLQLMASNDWQANRVQQITQITMGLKALAKELNVPVIALSQLSRNLEGRVNKRPMLSDLRESGSIEQDADIVTFVYREDYYLEREKPDVNDPDYVNWLARLDQMRGRSEVIIAKHRHGPIGTVDLFFNAQHSFFHDGSKRDEGLGL